MPKDRVHVQGHNNSTTTDASRGGLLDTLLLPLLLLREHWQIVRTSRAMLSRFRRIARSQPRLGRTEAYRVLVQDYLHCDRRAADRILSAAAQSFAAWPEDRDLQLRDVIHYVTVTEFLQQRTGERGMRSDVQSVVHALVPQNL